MTNDQLVAELLRVELSPRINFAMLENDVPVVQTLCVENSTEEDLSSLRVRIVAEPEFALPWEQRVDLVRHGSSLELNAKDLALSPGFLGQLTERTRGYLHFELHDQEQLLQRHSVPVDLLARDEWTGLTSLPEILAAFVQPNHPGVAEVLGRSARVLARWSGDAALDGYASGNPKRVFTTAAAIYLAIQNLDLSYSNPPASFEAEGQRVRLPDRILNSGMATCLDLALFCAGCLEQTGLHALLVVVRGHAFVGVWLREECFGEAVTHEPLRLRKRVDLNEILIFDPTYVTARPAVDFERARSEARARLEDVDQFECVIDVHRARKGGIRPLPSAAQVVSEEQAAGAVAPDAPAPDLESFEIHSDANLALDQPGEDQVETPATRLDRWQRRLLDLSLRNRLINFKDSKKTIPLLCPDLAALEDALAEGKELALQPRPDEWQAGDPRDSEAQRERAGEAAMHALLEEELQGGRLRTALVEGELQRRAVETYRAARVGKEEGGSSALYLALGFLAWYDGPGSTRRHMAPLLLLPIELKRKTVRSGFTILAGEDEPRVNVSLIELLSKEYGLTPQGLDPLPERQGGLDVGRIFLAFREAVKDMDRWDVVEECQLGLFSFAKFLMWRDLNERAGELLESPVVKHLVERPGEDFEPEASFPNAERLDDERALSSTYCPMAADSSQLSAIFAAADGRSFVLEGPPGTGKSQTITNLIAHCLAEQKSVLFISEKMAALSVVYRRLQSIGLGRFCLELHSNKATKRGFYQQLDQALKKVDAKQPTNWERECERLEEMRSHLNQYVRALHAPRAAGESVFSVLSRLIGLSDAKEVNLSFEGLEEMPASRLAELRESVDRLRGVALSVGSAPDNPWRAAGAKQWTPSFEDQVAAQIEALQAALDGFGECLQEVEQPLGLRDLVPGWQVLGVLDELAALLADIPGATAAFLLAEDREAARQRILDWVLRGRVRDSLRQRLYANWNPRLLEQDLDALGQRWSAAQSGFFPIAWWRRRSLRKELASFTKSGQAPGADTLQADLETAVSLRVEEREFASSQVEGERLLGRHWQGGDADWSHVEAIVQWAEALCALVARAAGSDLERANHLGLTWSRLATEGRSLLAKDAPLGQGLQALRSAWSKLAHEQAATEQLLELAPSWREPLGEDQEPAPAALDQLRAVLDGWRQGMRQLRPWCFWKQTVEEALVGGLAPLLEAFEAGQLEAEELPDAFERGYAHWCYRAVLDAEPLLSSFFSSEHERVIARFAELDDQVMKLSGQIVIARLAARMPRPGQNELPGSEVGIMKREIAKRSRHMSVRRAFERLPNLIPRLKPCLLMSPLSVAQYLDAGYQKFDLVVFDEASQIPVWDAVGAIARGRQAVIVGDPKQLPPTNFFQKQEDQGFESDEDSEDDLVEDLESILDDCLGAGLHTLHLDWHYRSRHESLIAFSNAHYYQNRLLTFPSPVRDGMGVSFQGVPDGFYDKGKSRTNRKEAEAVVEEVRRRLADPELKQFSVGVVTFNQPQQILIEDLLEELRGKHPELEAAFAEDADEQVFVKNLENVQGDERDVILFSIGYGPDESGRVSMNFGPMNREGGERRLNVAVTRARREVLVFSTLRSDQIDLARTRARGVHDLKRFLAFAERGMLALGAPREEQDNSGVAARKSSFEECVRRALVEAGWKVDAQVGCSGYRIDLAVVDADEPERYLIGIECDGRNYQNANTARDRDKSRSAVLRGLGWELLRLWSNDWWADPGRELERLLGTLEAAQAKRRAVTGEAEAEDEAAGQAEPDSMLREAPATEAHLLFGELGAVCIEEEDEPQAVEGERSPGAAQARERPAGESPSGELPSVKDEEPKPADEPSDGPRPYRVLKRGRRGGAPESFTESKSSDSIQSALLAVVEREGPIGVELLSRRVASFWGIERFSAKVAERAKAMLEQCQAAGDLQLDDDGFVWAKDASLGSCAFFRVPDANQDPEREVEDLPPPEIAAAAFYLLQQHISVPLDDLVRQTARLFGFPRIGSRMQEHLQRGVLLLEHNPAVEIDAERLVLK